MGALTWVPLVLMILVGRLIPTPSPSDIGPDNQVYSFRDNHWTPAPKLDFHPETIEVSPSGAVWAAGRGKASLSQLENGQWHHWDLTGLGVGQELVWLQATSGEELWATAGQAVLRLNGSSRTRHAFRTAETGLSSPSMIVAAPDGVWAIDEEGRLARFDGSRWSAQPLAKSLPGLKQDAKERPVPPRLAVAAGQLWLFWQGLWRRDGDVWRQVQPPSVDWDQTYLLGRGPDRVWLWLWGTGEIAAVGADGQVVQKLAVSGTGLATDVALRGLRDDGQIWLAASSGLARRFGNRWTKLAPPPGCALIADFAAGPDGAVWVLASPGLGGQVFRALVPAGLALLVFLGVTGTLFAMWMRGRTENRLAAELAAAQSAGDVPAAAQATAQREAKRAGWGCGLAVAGGPFALAGIGAGAGIFRMIWPGVPEWLAFGAPAVAIAAVAYWLWLRFSSGSAVPAKQPVAEDSAKGSSLLARPTKWLLYLAVFVVLTRWLPVSWVDRLVPLGPLADIIKVVISVVALTVIFSGRDMLAVLLVRPAWAKGDYDRALRLLRGMGLGWPTVKMIEMEGLTHAMAGRPAQAEPYLRKALAGSQNHSQQERVMLLGCLAEALFDQGRHEESLQLREKALELGDSVIGTSRASLAESLLHLGVNPERALALVDEAMRIAKGRMAERIRPLRCATRAWALAQLGRREEAQDAVEQALKPRDEPQRGIVSETRYQAAQALLVLGEKERALQVLREASEANPKGRTGILAAQCLAEHSVWGK